MDPSPEMAPRDAYPLVRASDALLIDVREPDEWAEARIPGARLIPLGELAERLDELPRDATIILQCRSGNRSRSATQALREAGFARAVNLRGGILAWAQAGLPLER